MARNKQMAQSVLPVPMADPSALWFTAVTPLGTAAASKSKAVPAGPLSSVRSDTRPDTRPDTRSDTAQQPFPGLVTTDNPLHLSWQQQSPGTAVPVTATRQAGTTAPLSSSGPPVSGEEEEPPNDFIINNPLQPTAPLPQKVPTATTTSSAPAAWLKSVNEKGLTQFRHSVSKEVWVKYTDEEDTWYVSGLTKESAWELPPP
jgi:hypothetical protein